MRSVPHHAHKISSNLPKVLIGVKSVDENHKLYYSKKSLLKTLSLSLSEKIARMKPNPGETEQPTNPKHGTWDRSFDFHEREAAIKATNEKFHVLVGNGTLNQYTEQQALFFAKQIFHDESIVRAKITSVKNVSNGFNEFYVEAWV